ncbi:hypothetical protein [Henriciella litoralis]|uniref:hypothetical protein n=1 Tax=Henriciella litoralis TaxID=568102 RepID=UPI000A02DA52|nr:hypothetical protein [Henriciella litoralis]
MPRHIIALICVLVAVAACDETIDERYASQAEFLESGMVEAGFAPDWIPEDARDIRMSLDVDSFLHVFRFDTKELDDVLAECRPIDIPNWTPHRRGRNYKMCSSEQAFECGKFFVSLKGEQVCVWRRDEKS